jgi:hypothetical protein
MKKFLLFSFFLSSVVSNAQKVDLDRFYFDVSYQKLPTTIIPFEKRTFATVIITDGTIAQQFDNAKVLNNRLNIDGWKKVQEDANVNVTLNLSDFYEEGRDYETRTVEEKDKDGKVTRSYPMYTLVTTYVGKGYANIVKPVVEKPAETAAPVVTEVKSTNRFLKSVAPEAASGSTNTTNQSTFSYSGNFKYKSSENTSQAALEKEARFNKEANYNTRLREYVNYAINGLNDQLNYNYGFSPVSFKEQLWIIDSKEEEGAIQKEAIEAVKLQFSQMKANEPIDKLTADLQPLIEYFDSLKTKYTEDNKGSKKIRYSAYYNLGKIYLYLDQPEKAIKEGEGLIANDYDKGDGKDLVKAGNKLLENFNKLQWRTRHNPIFK